MNLLSMAREQGVLAADEFVPVLVYVLIKVLTESSILLLPSYASNEMQCMVFI